MYTDIAEDLLRVRSDHLFLGRPKSAKAAVNRKVVSKQRKNSNMENPNSSCPSMASLRWAILRQAFLSHPSSPSPSPSQSDDMSQMGIKSISRKVFRGFDLIPCVALNEKAMEETCPSLKVKDLDVLRNAFVRYSLPMGRTRRLDLIQRVDNHVDLNDFKICNRYDIDNTGLVCQWPSEDVLAYFCLIHADIFRSKRVLELGSGYGLAGLVIAANTDASEVIISDGNPQVVDYIQHSIQANAELFSCMEVKSMTLHWNQEQVSNILNSFDIIIASDCTFFKEFHESLALTVKSLLKHSKTSEALFFSPKRGDSLDKFLEKIEEIGMHFCVIENYDSKVWELHLKFLSGEDSSWPNYDTGHCYPLLVRVTF